MTIAVYLGHNTTTTHHSIVDNFEMANIGASLCSQPCQNHVLTNQLETLLKSYGHTCIGDIVIMDTTYRSGGKNILDKIMYVYFSQSLDCGFQNEIFCFNDMYITESRLLCFS